MDLEHKLETICKNRIEVKSNNAIVRESLQLIGILLLASGISLGLATSLDVIVTNLISMMNWSKEPLVIVVTIIIQLIVFWWLTKFCREKNKK